MDNHRVVSAEGDSAEEEEEGEGKEREWSRLWLFIACISSWVNTQAPIRCAQNYSLLHFSHSSRIKLTINQAFLHNS